MLLNQINELSIQRFVRRGLTRTLILRRGTRLRNVLTVVRASRLISKEPQTVLFVTSLLRAREIKMASALRRAGWKVILIYLQTTPFDPGSHFDEAICAGSELQAHMYAKALAPTICHVFSGAVDGLIYRFCADKPGPVVIDMNDIFCASLFDYCHERFQPTRDCLERADGLCARDLQANSAERLDGFRLPRHTLLFPEYSWRDGPKEPGAAAKGDPDEVRVVSVGTFCLETLGMYDSRYLRLAELLTEQRIHLHIYPHWFYRKSNGSVFNWDLRKDFADFFRLEEKTEYLHVHESLSLDELAQVLPRYDFGIVAGGSPALDQKLRMLKPEYMRTCYSGRIADYLDARLPVLINREVRFNFWLLKRYGVGVDLEGLSRPGFREHLLAIKRDRRHAARVDEAARKLSLDRNIDRLTAFYGRIIDDAGRNRVRLGYPLSLAKSVPALGGMFQELELSIRRVNQTAASLRSELEAQKEDGRRRHVAEQRLVEKQQRLLERLQWHLDQGAAGDEVEKQEVLLESRSLEGADIEPRHPHQRRSIVKARLSLEVERGSQWADEVAGLLNWPEIRNSVEQSTGMPELMEMLRLFAAGSRSMNQLSSCWQVLGFKNFNQLLRDGYRNFKRTIGFNYFTFLVQKGDPQIASLESKLDAEECAQLRQAAASLPDDPDFDWKDQQSYRYFVLMLWSYARKVDTMKYLARLDEPEEGNPLTVPANGKRASQDLANSVLEYYSMSEAVDFGQCKRVLEIGGGYGRDAYVIMKLHPHIQYTLVDIPPALWVAQRYLSSVFSERSVFRVRDFETYQEVADEIELASIVFLLPHQAELIPHRRFDLSLNISSFGEMQPGQVNGYFRLLDRVTRGYFYTKQWKVSQNAFDHVTLTEDSYPVSRNWTKVYSRTCPVQNGFFEALYRVTGQRS